MNMNYKIESCIFMCSDSGEAIVTTSAKRKERESSDDVPTISLDERLRAITGEAPPEHPSPVESPKAMEPAPEANQVG